MDSSGGSDCDRVAPLSAGVENVQPPMEALVKRRVDGLISNISDGGVLVQL